MRNAQDHANAAGQDLRISGLSERLTEVENRIDKLAALRHRLQRALRHAEEAPRAKSCRCRIIESACNERQVEIGRPGRSRRSRR